MARTLVVIGVIGIIFLIGRSMMPEGPDKVLTRLNEKEIFLRSIKVPYQDSLFMHVMTFGDSTAQPLVLVHGSPGDWSAWENLITNDTILEKYYVVAVDRPGFGRTTIGPQSSLSLQTKPIWTVVDYLNLKNAVLVGHSYGGAVVEQLLIEHPEAFKLAIFVAATLSPELMKPRWYNTIADWKIINYLLANDLVASNIEMMGLPESLKEIEKSIDQISTPIVLIQGKKDVLVPYETVEYYKSHKTSGVTYFLLEDVNHFIPWTDPNLITDILINDL